MIVSRRDIGEKKVELFFAGWPEDKSLRLGFEASYIPGEGDTFTEIDNSVWEVIVTCPHCHTHLERHVYALVDQLTGLLKEIV